MATAESASNLNDYGGSASAPSSNARPILKAAPVGPQLKILEKVSYALGDAGANFIYKTIEFFLLFFYTDIFGITPLQAGMIFLVARICDAITDPLMGALADRTKSRFGRFRPYLLFGALPLGALSILSWQVPALTSGYKLAYAYLTYILMMTAYTVVNIPYSALMGVMTPQSDERTSLSSYRFVGAFLAALVVQFATMRLVEFFGGGESGWSLTMTLFSIAAVLCTWLCFFGTTERIFASPTGQDFRGEARAVLGNRAWRCLAVLGVFVIANFSIRGAAFAYYFKYHIGDASLWGMHGHAALLGAFLTSGGIANVVGVLLTTPLAKRFGKKEVYIALMLTGSLLALPLFWLGRNELSLIFALNIITAVILGPTAPLLFAMYGDVADDVEFRSGHQATGLVYAGSLFALKLGGALGGFFAGVLFTWAGYVAGQEQSETTIVGIVMLVSVLPAILGSISLAVLFFYPLNKSAVERLPQLLEERRKGSEIG